MKKIFTLVVSALLAGSAFAQDVPYIFSEVEPNTFAVTKTQEEIAAAYDAQWVTDAWNMGVAFPAGTVMYENENLVITAAVDKTPVFTSSGKITQIKEEFPGYTGYVNLGSTFAQNQWTGDEAVADVSEMKATNQGVVLVTPKVKGTLSFGVYAGNNTRSIGIYKLATEADMAEEDYGGWVNYNNFRNDGENGTVNNAPAYVEGVIEPGHGYALVGGGSKNLCLHQIKFVPAEDTGISSTVANAAKKVTAVYTAGGAQVSGLQKGLNIVKYSDGTTAKVLK